MAEAKIKRSEKGQGSRGFVARGQGSIEFMVMVSMLLVFFVLVVVVYAQEATELGLLQRSLASGRICTQLSQAIDAMAAGPSGGSATIELPPTAAGIGYGIRVNASQRYIKVEVYNATGTPYTEGSGCTLRSANITNSSGGSSISLGTNVTMNNSNGVVILA